MRKLLAAALLVVGLSGCATAEPAAAPSTPAVEATPTASPSAFCDEYMAGIQSYADFILDTATASVDVAEYKIQLSRMQSLEAIAPSEVRAKLAQYSDPVYQIKAVVDAGGGNLTFNTDGYKTAAVEIPEYCVSNG